MTGARKSFAWATSRKRVCLYVTRAWCSSPGVALRSRRLRCRWAPDLGGRRRVFRQVAVNDGLVPAAFLELPQAGIELLAYVLLAKGGIACCRRKQFVEGDRLDIGTGEAALLEEILENALFKNNHVGAALEQQGQL